MEVIDTHVHLGADHKYKKYLNQIRKGTIPITKIVAFPHCSDISQAGREFTDDDHTKKSREDVNDYVLSLAEQKTKKIDVFPFKFIWPDFNRGKLNRYWGVKWHRHDPQPSYNIQAGDAKPSILFNKLLAHLRDNKMPIIFEDDFENLKTFIGLVDRVGGKKINVIIPHLGFGTQSYEKIKNTKINDTPIFEKSNVYTDTSYASKQSLDAIKDYIETYGYNKIFFGSDYPFAHPQEELEKIRSLGLDDKVIKAITSGNILRLMNKVRTKKQPN